MIKFRACTILLGLALALPGGLACAQAVSEWSKGLKSSVRLIAGGAGTEGVLKAGIEITLDRGYKTYWRSPGDSGLPPRFDWSASENVGGITVSWPVPERFEDGVGYSIGYASDIILPLSVRAINPGKPVKLVLNLDYAVCEKLCIPATGKASILLTPQSTPEAARIARFKALVPVDGAKTEGARARPIELLPIQGQGERLSLQVTIMRAAEEPIDDIFIEGPDSWAFGKPEFRPLQDGRIAALIEVTDKPKSITGTVPLVLTLRGGAMATETRIDLDIPGGRP